MVPMQPRRCSSEVLSVTNTPARVASTPRGSAGGSMTVASRMKFMTGSLASSCGSMSLGRGSMGFQFPSSRMSPLVIINKHCHHVPNSEWSLVAEHLRIGRLLADAAKLDHDRSVAALARPLSYIPVNG